MTEDRLLQHVHRLPVRWGDMDAMGHVNNSRFFTYFEQARLAWLQTLDLSAVPDRAGPVVARTACDFRQPITHPATLEIRVFTGAPGRTSLPTYYEVRLAEQEELVAEGEATLVLIDRSNGRPLPLPEEFRAQLEAA